MTRYDLKDTEAMTSAGNPEGWQEVDGVKLPSVWSWAEWPSEFVETNVVDLRHIKAGRAE